LRHVHTDLQTALMIITSIYWLLTLTIDARPALTTRSKFEEEKNRDIVKTVVEWDFMRIEDTNHSNYNSYISRINCCVTFINIKMFVTFEHIFPAFIHVYQLLTDGSTASFVDYGWLRDPARTCLSVGFAHTTRAARLDFSLSSDVCIVDGGLQRLYSQRKKCVPKLDDKMF